MCCCQTFYLKLVDHSGTWAVEVARLVTEHCKAQQGPSQIPARPRKRNNPGWTNIETDNMKRLIDKARREFGLTND